eukprot:TRINITY_DN9675_c0_g1_i12.p1 TRINITY_DN9675_c0_g1~~TRINITY_DN9675_c0_g1_i12.p1  ORF type:complete len:394 (-),score=106.17 TRINITY_DN9675_c0_g1_i12:222-1403(-)
MFNIFFFFFFQAEDGIRDAQESRGLGDVYKRQVAHQASAETAAQDAREALQRINAKFNDQLQIADRLSQQLGQTQRGATANQQSMDGEIQALRNEISLKESQSLEYHNALRKLGESAQYSEERVGDLTKQLDEIKQGWVSEQQARLQAESFVCELRELANMDVLLLSTRLKEERQEFSTDLSRLRCELRETVAGAQTNEADVNEKLAIQRAKLQEFRERSKVLMDEKDSEVERLVRKINELQEDIKSGRPLERGFFDIARAQAANEHDSLMLRDQLQQSQQELGDKCTYLQQVRQRESELKAEVRELTARVSRAEGLDMEYLKNVMVKYMQSRHAEEQQKMMIPLLAKMLHFTPEDHRAVYSVFSEDSSSSIGNMSSLADAVSAATSYLPGYK